MLRIAKKMYFSELLPDLARYTFLDYRAQYDGKGIDQKHLTEDIPLVAAEESESDHGDGNLSQQSFTHAYFDQIDTFMEAKGGAAVPLFRPRDP